MSQWPKQSECVAFYGNPRDAKFESEHLTSVPFPWMAVLAWDTKQRAKGALVNKKCAESLARVFAIIWSAAGQSQDVINGWGLNEYGGGYCFRRCAAVPGYRCTLTVALLTSIPAETAWVLKTRILPIALSSRRHSRPRAGYGAEIGEAPMACTFKRQGWGKNGGLNELSGS